MSSGLPLPPPGFDDLTVDEKLEYLLSLWDMICADAALIPVPDWHKEVLSERLQQRKASSVDVRDWTDIREELRRGLKKK